MTESKRKNSKITEREEALKAWKNYKRGWTFRDYTDEHRVQLAFVNGYCRAALRAERKERHK